MRTLLYVKLRSSSLRLGTSLMMRLPLEDLGIRASAGQHACRWHGSHDILRYAAMCCDSSRQVRLCNIPVSNRFYISLIVLQCLGVPLTSSFVAPDRFTGYLGTLMTERQNVVKPGYSRTPRGKTRHGATGSTSLCPASTIDLGPPQKA